MKKICKIFIVLIIIFLLLTFNIYTYGTTVSPAQMEFNIKFSGEPVISNSDKVAASVIDSNNAIINVYNLTMKENKESVTYYIQNTSKDLHANVSMELTNSNTEYFLVESFVEKTNLENGEATKITVNVELIKEPKNKTEIATIKIKLVSTPVQPIQDGSDNNRNDSNKNESDSVIDDYLDYYKKDETPKTGRVKFFEIFKGVFNEKNNNKIKVGINIFNYFINMYNNWN